MGIAKSIAKKGIDIGLEGTKFGLETVGFNKAAENVESVQEGIDIANTFLNILIGIIIFLIIYLILIVYKILCKLFCWRYFYSKTKRKKCQRKCGIGKFCFRLPFI